MTIKTYAEYGKLASLFNDTSDAFRYWINEAKDFINSSDVVAEPFTNIDALNVIYYLNTRLKMANARNDNYVFIIYSEIKKELKSYMKKRFYKDYSLWEKIKFYFL